MTTQTVPGVLREHPGRVLPVPFLMVLVLLVLLAASPARGLEFSSGREERDFKTALGLLEGGDTDLARHQFQSFLDEYPGSPARGRAWVGLAEIHFDRGEYDTAARFYERGLAEELPDTNTRGTALERGLEAALRANEIEQLSGFLSRYHRWRGDTKTRETFRSIHVRLRDRGDTRAVLTLARKQLENHPDSAFWKYELALLHARRGEYNRALPLLDGLGEPWTRLRFDATLTKAEIQLQQGNLDAAESRYEFLLRHDVHDTDARYGLAWVAIKRGNRQLARDYLALVTHAIGPLRAEAARDLARIHREEDRPGMALKWYQHARRWAPPPMRKKIEREAARYRKERSNP